MASPPADTRADAPVAQSGDSRSVGLLGATGVGVGAIVGGGILVLAGVAFRATGPGSLAAFALNGLIALLTALSFAEMSAAFPQSGGAYTFAKKVLSVRAAFAVGWILWFAYIVAGVLYALGFAEYAAAMLGDLWRALIAGPAPPWLQSKPLSTALALGSGGAYTLALIRRNTGGGQLATVGKVIVFIVLVAVGLFVLARSPSGTAAAGLTPFLPRGFGGLVQAMGFTFIALQGFDLIAAIAGEVRQPARVIPRAMFLSLGAALAIYLPLLFVVSTVGIPEGGSIVTLSQQDPGTVMARAVAHFMGPTGYWLVMVAAVLSTLSALQANLLAASRVALSMARDRTLPRVLAGLHPERATPVMAVYASALALFAMVLMLPDLAAAGAAASLIFLISFALAHWTSYLARRRVGTGAMPFQTPWFPAVQSVGGIACLGLALFQAVQVPAAGGIVAVWLGLGVIFYLAIFAQRAQAVDAYVEAHDPALARLRGHSPLVLVPVANPASAASLVDLALALAPPVVGRVMLLSVVRHPDGGGVAPEALERTVAGAQQALGQALLASLRNGPAQGATVARAAEADGGGPGSIPEALLTVAPSPWVEIGRVARAHRCESLLVGMSRLAEEQEGSPMAALLTEVECDVVVLRAPEGFRLEQCRRVLVPVAGHGGQDVLRARVLGSLVRGGGRQVTFLRVVPGDRSEADRAELERDLAVLAAEEAPGSSRARVVAHHRPADAIVEQAAEHDLLILGMQTERKQRRLGEVAVQIVDRAPCAAVVISRRI